MRFLHFKLLAAAVLTLGLTACGDDDPEDNSTPLGMEEPNLTPTPEPEPVNPYHVPTSEELYGKWRCVWHKSVSNFYVDDLMGWKATTHIYNEEEWAAERKWPLDIEFYDNEYVLSHFLPDNEKAEFIAAVKNNTTWKSPSYDIEYTYGSLKSGGYMWKPYTPNDSFLIQLYQGGKFQYSWTVTQFDGDSFMASRKYNIASDWKAEVYYQFKRITD